MDDIIKIVKSLEDSGTLGTLGASLLGDILSKSLSGKGVIRAGEGAIRAGYGSKKSFKKF